ASVPPNSVDRTSQIDGNPCAASTIVGTVVINSRRTMRGLVSWMYAVVVLRSEGRGAVVVSGSPAVAGKATRGRCSANRRETVARAISAAQIRTASAMCATTAAGLSRDQTFAAP